LFNGSGANHDTPEVVKEVVVLKDVALRVAGAEILARRKIERLFGRGKVRQVRDCRVQADGVGVFGFEQMDFKSVLAGMAQKIKWQMKQAVGLPNGAAVRNFQS
jgi:hypothetical protein